MKAGFMILISEKDESKVKWGNQDQLGHFMVTKAMCIPQYETKAKK